MEPLVRGNLKSAFPAESTNGETSGAKMKKLMVFYVPASKSELEGKAMHRRPTENVPFARAGVVLRLYDAKGMYQLRDCLRQAHSHIQYTVSPLLIKSSPSALTL